jgi:hypothetical protein
MTINRKSIVIIATGVLVAIGVAASAPPKGQYKNLKVLPKDISPKALSKIMVDDFGDGLGVSCTFCHAEEKGSHRPDYASDAKPEKLIARSMMAMTLKINKKYFMARHPEIGSPSLLISCTTCHNGVPHPTAF